MTFWQKDRVTEARARCGAERPAARTWIQCDTLDIGKLS